MNIAIMIDSLAIGGAQKHIRQVACGLASSGHLVSIYVLNEIVDPLYSGYFANSGIAIQVLGRKRVLNGLGLIQTGAKLRAKNTEVLIVVLFVSTIFGRIAAQLAGGIPVVVCLQARNLNYSFWQNFLLRVTSQLNVFTLSNSRSAIDWEVAEGRGTFSRHVLVENAVDSGGMSAANGWQVAGLPHLNGMRVIGSLGRLTEQKGYDILLAALSLLPIQQLNVKLVVFGEGPDRKKLECLRKELNLEDAVFFPGERRDAADFLPLMELYVQPSRFEGTPNAVMEALAAGVCVIASAVDGIAEVDAPPSLLVKIDYLDAENLAEAIYQKLQISKKRNGGENLTIVTEIIKRYPLSNLIESYDRVCRAAHEANRDFVII